MLGALTIGAAALSAAGSIYGGIKGAQAGKKAREYLTEQRRLNQDWYNRNYNENATQRADAQYMLTQVEDSIRRRNRAAAGTSAVMGGPSEAVAAAKEQNNQALSQTAAQIAARGASRKDAIDAAYRQTDASIAAQLANAENARAQNIAGAVQGLGNAMGQIAAADIQYGNGSRKPQTPSTTTSDKS